MKFKLIYNLFRARICLQADRKFKNQLWKKLDSAWQTQHPTNYWWISRPAFRYAMYVLIGLVIAGGGATGTYAYSSPEVTEGTILYPIKQKIEQIEEVTKRTPEAKAAFYLKQVKKREAEMEIMKKKTAMVNKIDGIKKMEKIDEQINLTEDKLERVNERLEKMEVKNPNLKPKVREVLENKVERKLERLREREKLLEIDDLNDEENVKGVKINIEKPVRINELPRHKRTWYQQK